MKKNIFVFMLLGLFLLSVVSAIPIYERGQDIYLTATCDNCTQVNITQITFPNSSNALLGNIPMSQNGTNYNYTFSETDTLGIYNYKTCGDLDGTLTCEDTLDRTFEIKDGGIKGIFNFDLSNTTNLIFIILYFLIALVFLMFKQNLLSGFMIVFGGIFMAFNSINLIISLIIMSIGTIIISLGEKE